MIVVSRFFIILSLCYTAITTASPLEYTQEELGWLKSNPVIKVANETDWPPFDFVQNGKASGYSIDIVHLMAEKAGFDIEFVNGYTWQQLMQMFKSGDIDLMPAIYSNKKRRQFAAFSDVYFSQPSVMVVNKNETEIRSIKELAGKRVVGIKGFAFTEYLEKAIPDVKMVLVDNVLGGLKAVSVGKADAFIESIGSVSYTLENNYIPNVKLVAEINNENLSNPPLHMAVAKDNVILLNIINKTLKAITRDEKNTLSNRWLQQINVSTLKSDFKLSDQHQQWLDVHPNLRIGIMNAWPPMDYVDTNGTPHGIGVGFINAINKRLGGRLKIVPDSWKNNYKYIQEKRLDAIMDITPRKEREKIVNFTRPYVEVPHLIFTRKDSLTRESLHDLSGLIVGVEKGFFIAGVIKDQYPDITVKEFNTTSDALDALSKEVTDAYIGNRAVASYIIENELIDNIKAQGKISETSSINAIGVRKDFPVLRDIIQLALDDISPAERSNIINPKDKEKSFEVFKAAVLNKLSENERAWLRTKPVISLGVDAEWPPVEWLDDKDVHQGMSSDYIKLISKTLGIEFKKPERMYWSSVLEGIEKGEIDMSCVMVSTEKRKKYVTFTRPYLHFPFVVFTQYNAPVIGSLTDLRGKIIGVEAGYSTVDWLENNYPYFELAEYNTTKDVLYALSVGDIDAYVGNLTVTSYILNSEGLTNIKVAAPTEYNLNLSIGVRKTLPQLRSILDKFLSTMTEVQHSEIRQRWLKLNYDVKVNYELVKKTIFISISILLVLFIWVYYIQRQRKLLAKAKHETDEANKAYSISNEKLLEANIKLKELDKMKSMFVASISHELRTPLNSIIGFSSLMMHGSFGELNERYSDYVKRINNSGQHLLSLITDIIDISKIESGRIDVVIEEFNLNDVIMDAVNSLKEQIDKSDLTLSLDLGPQLDMRSDRRRIYQCLLNFLSNSIKYSEDGNIHLSVTDSGENVVVKVKDDGIGIGEEDMERLFVAFERMDSHLRVKAGGTGLGLYLTKKIAEDILQGNVGAESKLGEGSVFWLNIPKSIKPIQS